MGAQEGENGGNSGGPTDQVKTDDLYENRTGAKKVIRVITVMAYMVSVSFVAMVLSGYYVFLWQPPNPRLLHRAQQRTDPQMEYRVDDEPLSGKISGPDHLVGQQSLRNRFSNMSGATILTNESKNSSETNLRRNETVASVPRISSATWDPVVRRVIDVAQTSSSVERSLNYSSDVNGLGSYFNGSHHFIERFAQNVRATSSSPRPSSPVITVTGSPTTWETTTEATFDNDVQARNRSDEYSLFNMTPISYGGSVENEIADHRIVIGTTTNGTPENYDIATANYATSGAREIRGDRTIEKFDDERKVRPRAQPNKSGSHMSRVPAVRVITNNSVAHEKYATNAPVEVSSPDFMGDSVTEDMEGTSESSAIESASLIVHPDLQLSDEERKETTNQRLTQDTDDFDFI